MPKYSFYKDGDNYVLVTNQSPAGFKGMLYATWRGSVSNLTEVVSPVQELSVLEQVDSDDVPDAWFNAFAKRTKLFKKRVKEAPRPAPCSVSRSVPVVVDVQFPPLPTMFQPQPVTFKALVNCVLMFLAAVILLILIIGVTSC